MEIWKDIKGYEGKYQVSNLGNVKSLNYHKTNKEKTMVGKTTMDGYKAVILSRNQHKKHCRVHRLVAEAFIPNPNNLPQINHKDRNKLNNEVSNLEWVTARENTLHCIGTGRKPPYKAVMQYTKEMNLLRCWNSIKEASVTLGVLPHNISSCCNGKIKTAYGFIWKHKGV